MGWNNLEWVESVIKWMEQGLVGGEGKGEWVGGWDGRGWDNSV